MHGLAGKVADNTREMLGGDIHLLGIELYIALFTIVLGEQIHKFLEILGTALLDTYGWKFNILAQHCITNAVYYCTEEVSQR